MKKDLLAHKALAQIPKILTLLDRNVHSPTYGCFDRNFWHYKIIDFPSGMAQEFVWPLALVYTLDLPGNLYYQKPALRTWVEAALLYAAKSAHRDGSCDDYFPFERAGGATAFALLAAIESYQLLHLDNRKILDFLRQRTEWLAHHHESGRLTNHQALIALCLELAGNCFKTNRWNQAKTQRLERVLQWQDPEGWFQEYEGFDPGYHTLTIYCLARLYALHPSEAVKASLINAVTLATHFIHPDGSYGGEYASRNTYNFFPCGFELVGRWFPAALRINDLFLEGLANGKAACYEDDHIIGHHTWNYLLTWQEFVATRPADVATPPDGRLMLPNAQILIDRRHNSVLYVALNKGGVCRYFKDQTLCLSDTQISLQINDRGRHRNAVAHLVGHYKTRLSEDEIIIQGRLGWAKQKQMTPQNLLILRVVMLTFGRFFPNLIRKLLQKLLITGQKQAPFEFIRHLRWQDGQWHLHDEVKALRGWDQVVSAGIAADQTSIYIVMSRTFQVSQLQPWLDLTPQIRQLQSDQPLQVERLL
jgi:hypothetical protein